VEVKWTKLGRRMLKHRNWNRNEKGNEILINFSQWFKVKGEKKEDLVGKVDKSAMSIRTSRNLVKKNSGTRALLNLSFRH
jgi:hypothetical protein